MSYRKHLMPSDISPSAAYEATAVDSDTDTISRQVAIDALLKCGDYYKGNDEAKRGVSQCVGVIYDLPSAQPERIKGLWIEHDDGITACECSVCHEKYNLYEEDVFGRNFCPNCGADMREVTT